MNKHNDLFRLREEEVEIEGTTYKIRENTVTESTRFTELFFENLLLNDAHLPMQDPGWPELNARRVQSRNGLFRFVLNNQDIPDALFENLSDRALEGIMDLYSEVNQGAVTKMGEKILRLASMVTPPAAVQTGAESPSTKPLPTSSPAAMAAAYQSLIDTHSDKSADTTT